MSEQKEYEDTVGAAVTLLHSQYASQPDTTYGQHCGEIANKLRAARVIVVKSRSQERRVRAMTNLDMVVDPVWTVDCAETALRAELKKAYEIIENLIPQWNTNSYTERGKEWLDRNTHLE